MLFNSIDFAIFLPVVFYIYWFVLNNNLKIQNAFLVLVSYVFYGWWDYRFLALILFSTLLDYLIGIQLAKISDRIKRKALLWLSITVNLGFLGFFKYCNFFIDSFAEAFLFFGYQINTSSLDIILPVGISFYTFQTLSYTIDVYNQKLTPTKDIIAFSAFVSFFPQLVAGPIERATNLLPQFYDKRTFNTENAISGIHLITWGLFKKVVIGDSCALYVNTIFNNYENLNTISLCLGAVYFAFQIYGDFSGYSDIAIGTSRLFGFSLKKNFNYPYFSRDISEFWRRWHISLSTWFRDYLYIPLGGSKGNTIFKIRNVFIIFLVSGFWHGANWTFIFWGFLNALFFIPLMLQQQNRRYLGAVAENTNLPKLKEFIQIIYTFSLVLIGWVFFRADSVTVAFQYIYRLFSFNFEGGIQYLSIERHAVELLVLLLFFIIIEWYTRNYEHPFYGKYKIIKVSLIITALLSLGVYSKASDFIYFQF